MRLFRWLSGRQLTGYQTMLLFESQWLQADAYLIRYPACSVIPEHVDPVKERDHYRLNIILKQAIKGGEFKCAACLFETKRIKFFRPDREKHSVTLIEEGERLVLSIGWTRKRKQHGIS